MGGMPSLPRYRVDPKQRRTFTPPAQRARRPWRAAGWPPADWREGIAPGLSRGFCAVVFAAVPTLETRFASATLSLVCLGLAAFVGALVYLSWKMRAPRALALLGPDVASLALLLPTIAVASGLEVADTGLGGRSTHFLLAGVAVLGVLGLVALVAATLGLTDPDLPALAALPGALSVAVVLGGGARFAAGSLANGLSVAWMLAGLATFGVWLARRRVRPAIPASVFAIGAAIVIVAGASAGGQNQVSSGNAGLAYIVTVVAGLVILGLPRLTASFARDASAEPAADIASSPPAL